MRMRFLLVGTFGFALFGSSLIVLALAQQGVASGLVADGPGNTPVVAAALTMTPYLYNCPPEQLDQCYTSGFPQAAIAFWQRTCPGCRAWQNGDLQCVMLVTAAYGLAGQQLPAVGNAIDFWSLYHNRPGWTEIPSGSGAPLPGDMMVLSSPYFGGVGHIVIVVAVRLPTNGQVGSITIAQANGPGAINTFPLPPDLVVHTWTNFTVLGFIRHMAVLQQGTPAGG